MRTQKTTLLALSVAFALTGCGGGDDSSTGSIGSNGPNRAPQLSVEALNTDRGQPMEVMSNNEQIVRWEVSFEESEVTFTDPSDPNQFVDFYDIDLLQGISDPDGDTLSVKNVTFLWSGPDCANTTVDAANFPDVCDPILAEFGVEAGSTITPEIAADIREYQNLPVVDQAIFGFEFLESKLRVTPRNFAPILRSGQTAELGFAYEVTDGEQTLQRQIVAIVNGKDKAPSFIETNADGTPRLDSDGNQIAVEPPSLLVSEKSDATTIDMVAGLYDQDIYDVQAWQREIGNLEDYYSSIRNLYTQENLNIVNFTVTASNGMQVPDGFASFVRHVDPITGLMTGADLTINASVFAEILSAGEVVDVTVSFGVSDGNNVATREIVVTVLGADEENAPIFFDDLEKTVESTSDATSINLLEDAIELDGDEMSVVGLTPVGSTETEYGIFLNGNRINIDPYHFTYLSPGETKQYSYTYQITDGNMTSDERRVDVTIKGVSANLAARGTNSDPSFESGSLDSSAWIFQPDPASEATAANLFVTDAEQHSGDYSLTSMQDGMFTTLGMTGIQQNQIDENDLFYISVYAKVAAAPWGTLNGLLNRGDNFDRNNAVENLVLQSALGVTNNWVERITTLRASDYFDPGTDEQFSLSLLMNQNTQFDDVAIVKVNSGGQNRQLISNGRFLSPSAQGWSVTGDANLEVTLDANRASNGNGSDYGLHVTNNTGEKQRLELDPSFFPQGAIKKGMRYIIQFDMRTPSYTSDTGAVPIEFGIFEVAGSNFTKRVDFAKRSPTEWTTYYMHIDTTSDSRYFGGNINSDVNFDWSSTTVQPALYIRAGDELQIDNISMYPVPRQ
ncbi:hypothetical protein KL866_19350 [Alteromonas sp. ALT199]|uniref:Ig-like domain-containing protein n=1 Tax=unclassified Alteromonas TaxID=2614992 RepID=UPI001BE51848|nr:hypothetical protein [Alteromonas sp. ALT199]MBT3137211.1 hypothetical protein [Alteromonas sp. ALT199]